MSNSTNSSLAATNCKAAFSALRTAYQCNEESAVTRIITDYPMDRGQRNSVARTASLIVSKSRARKDEQGSLDAFLAEFGLSNQEGVALMCLAEALLRVPDGATQDQLIAEKVLAGDWGAHKGHSDSLFVNASTWALMLTGGVLDLDKKLTKNPSGWFKSLVGRSGEPVIRKAVNQAMKIMGKQFVFGRSIKEALKRQQKLPGPGTNMMSFDMLGEGARTAEAAERYFALYRDSIKAVGSEATSSGSGIHDRSSVSIKLSALHPRYEDVNFERVMAEMLPRIKELALLAKSYDIQMTIDAEEADRLEISLHILEALARDAELANWQGLGLAVQAYQKRAPYVIDWLIALARETGRKFPVRLVKGAYWDTEIKHAQELGLEDYPVYTRKASTDACYIYSAARMLKADDAIYGQFATHNAHTVAAIADMAHGKFYEFQRLHGMGELLYGAAADIIDQNIRLRTYAPVGQHEDLLPYLVRRLLENGANSSFVNRFLDAGVPVEDVVADPVITLETAQALRHTLIPLPVDMYGSARRNSKGWNLMNRADLNPLIEGLTALQGQRYAATSIVSGKATGEGPSPVICPQNCELVVGSAEDAREEDIENALAAAQTAQPLWNDTGGTERAKILRKTGDLIEASRDIFTDMLVREAGKTLPDCIAEIREAVDFCRYYADLAEKQFSGPTRLPGPTGEQNELYLVGRGTFLCIAPWNFPLAIFAGQVAAALVSGNAVIAKPAEQTPIVAWYAVKLFHKAGVPVDVLHLLLGSGARVGAALVADKRISGVAFTGSTATARLINQTLANRDGAIVPLIAETGGQNAMIVDSTALPEQVADDVIQSAFGAAGQRCSALRVLFLQDSVADKMIEMIKGALKERVIGDPVLATTDVGPIIDDTALGRLEDHCERMKREASFIAAAAIRDVAEKGTFLAPHIFEISSLDQLGAEIFGPVLHIIRYGADGVDDVLQQIRDTGYGLTLGVHSRLEGRWKDIFTKSHVGNSYINRNMVGAVVGVQPFGGEGLSGTGPKAGGPNYLLRFATERTLTINTAAVGGNAELFSMKEES